MPRTLILGFAEAGAAMTVIFSVYSAPSGGWKDKSRLDVYLRPPSESEGFDAAICEPDDCEEFTREEFWSEVELQR
jgi:hypothetical protein